MASLLIINIDGKKCQIPIPDNRPPDQLLKVKGTAVACPICQRLFSQHTWHEFDHFDKRFESGRRRPESKAMPYSPYSRIQTPEAIAEQCRGFKASFAEEFQAKLRCPFCTKLRGEHSEAEVTACVEVLRKKQERRSNVLEARKAAEEARKSRPE